MCLCWRSRMPQCSCSQQIGVCAADGSSDVLDELKMSQNIPRLMLETLRSSLSTVEMQRAAESAADSAGASPGPGAAAGCGELLRPADRCDGRCYLCDDSQ